MWGGGRRERERERILICCHNDPHGHIHIKFQGQDDRGGGRGNPHTHPPTDPLTHQPTHPPTDPLTHLHTHPPTHPPTEGGLVPADQVDMEAEEDRGGEAKHGRDEEAEDDLELVRWVVVDHVFLEGEEYGGVGVEVTMMGER